MSVNSNDADLAVGFPVSDEAPAKPVSTPLVTFLNASIIGFGLLAVISMAAGFLGLVPGGSIEAFALPIIFFVCAGNAFVWKFIVRSRKSTLTQSQRIGRTVIQGVVLAVISVILVSGIEVMSLLATFVFASLSS